MTVKANPKPSILIRNEPLADLKPDHVDAFQLQEQFTGPVPMWSGRPAAELLAERLAEADPANTSPFFIP